MTLLDTNIVIAYFNGDPNVVDFIDNGRLAGDHFCVSAITVTELLAYPRLTVKERGPLLNLFQNGVFVVATDPALAISAGDLCRTSRLHTADGIIAATALRMRVALATRDRDFLRVPGLTVITL